MPRLLFTICTDCEPTPAQAALHGEVAALLARAAEATALIAAYEDKGCAAHIQKALNTPSPESEEAAFQAVAACVVSIQKFYQVRNWKRCVCVYACFIDTDARLVVSRMNVDSEPDSE